MSRPFFRVSRASRVLFLCVVGLLSAALSALAQNEIFVSNNNSDSVRVFSRTASGNVAPIRNLVGAATLLDNPHGLAVDKVNNELLVANLSLPYSISVYLRTANGDVAPLRRITGALTGLNSPAGLSVDSINNEIAVANRPGNSVTIYSRTATGDVLPLRTITGFSNPTGVVIDPVNNEIFVAINGGSILVFARTASGSAAALRTITGANTGFNQGPLDVALDRTNNELFVTNSSFALTFKPTVQVFGRLATGDVAPLRKIIAGDTNMPGLISPIGVALDLPNNELFVVSSGNDSVRVFARTAFDNAAPVRVLSGGNTLLNGPRYVAVTSTVLAALDIDGDGDVEPLSDALLALRYFIGSRGPTLTNGAVDLVGCSRCNAALIEPYIAGLGNTLDIDNNLQIEPLNDGILMLRYLFRFRGTILTNNAVNTGNCNVRCNAAAIEPYIASLLQQ